MRRPTSERASHDVSAGARCSSCHCPEKHENRRGRAAAYSSLIPRVGNPYYSAIEQGEVDLPVESKISVPTSKPRKFSIRSKSDFEFSGVLKKWISLRNSFSESGLNSQQDFRKIVGCRAVGYNSLTPRVRSSYYSANEQGEVGVPVESKMGVPTPKPRKFSIRRNSTLNCHYYTTTYHFNENGCRGNVAIQGRDLEWRETVWLGRVNEL